MSVIGQAQFGVQTFFAASHPNDKCGANGLPLTPNSIKILGKFQALKKFYHSNVCKYLDINRTKHERLIVVSEYYNNNLLKTLKNGDFCSEVKLIELSYEILKGLIYLHEHGITHRNMSLSNILLTQQNLVKLSEYGLYNMTDEGTDVSFPIGKVKYMAPEVILCGPVVVDDNQETSVTAVSGPKVDCWSLGIILLELLLKKELWCDLSVKDILKRTIQMIKSEKEPLDYLIETEQFGHKLKEMTAGFQDFLHLCLTKSPRKRPSSKELKQHSIFKALNAAEKPYKNGYTILSVHPRCLDLELPVLDENAELDPDHLSQRSMEEVYYLWRLAGGDLEAILKKAGLIKTHPPISLLPLICTVDGEVFGQRRDEAELLDETTIILSQEQLRNRLKDIEEKAYYPLLEDE